VTSQKPSTKGQEVKHNTKEKLGKEVEADILPLLVSAAALMQREEKESQKERKKLRERFLQNMYHEEGKRKENILQQERKEEEKKQVLSLTQVRVKLILFTLLGKREGYIL